MDRLESAIHAAWPVARVGRLSASGELDPENKHFQLRGMLSELAGMPLDRASDFSAQLPTAERLASRYDWLLIDHAEQLSATELDLVRWNRRMPPVILVGRSQALQKTISEDPAFGWRVIWLETPEKMVGPGSQSWRVSQLRSAQD